jgi:hypothetical protein
MHSNTAPPTPETKKNKTDANKMLMQVETHGPSLNCASAKPAQNEEFSTL